MALEKTNIPVPFAQGVNTKSDDKQLLPGGLTRLENAVFKKLGQIEKRNGYEALGTDILGGGSITAARAISTFKAELNLYTNDKFYSYSSSADKWKEKGRVFNVSETSNSIIRNDNEQSELQVATENNLSLYTWADSRGGFRYTLLDDETKTVFNQDEVLFSGSEENIKLESLKGFLHVFFIDGTDLKVQKFNTVNPDGFEAAITLTSLVDAGNKNYAIKTIDDRIFISFQSTNAGGEIAVVSITTEEVISSTIGIIGETIERDADIITDEQSRVILFWSNSTDVKVAGFSFNLLSFVLPLTTIETIADISQVTGAYNSVTDEYEVVYDITNADPTKYLVKKSAVNLAASVTTPIVLLRSVSVASKSFKCEDINYFTVLHQSDLQSTYFVVNYNGEIVSKLSPGLAGTHILTNRTPHVPQLETCKFILTSQIKGKTLSEDNTLFSLLGVNSTIVDFDPETKYQDELLNNNLYITGGILQNYDGVTITEDGFHVFPEGIIDGGTATIGGGISDGQFQYVAVYKWIDNQGQIHRSAPSIPLSITLSGGTPTQTQTIDIPTLRLTDKVGIVIELYRTEDTGTIFHLVTEVASPNFNDKAVDIISIVDIISDSDLLSREILYTTGGVLENIAAPNATLITSFANRIFLSGLEDENKIAYSKLKTDGVAVEFSDFLTIDVQNTGGAITALAAMDGKLLIFKQSSIFVMAGDGPNNTGAQDTFTTPELIAADTGCNNPNSIVLVPNGIMFQSDKGIYLIDRGLNVVYIGINVEGFNDQAISSAVLVPDTNQVRFQIQNDLCLVYDYLVGQWSTFTNHEGPDADIYGDKYVYLRNDSQVYSEVNNLFTDNKQSIEMLLETGWMSFNGLQGFQRVYKMELLGKYFTPHLLRIKAAYDFNEAFIQEKTIDSDEHFNINKYGVDDNYGATTPYGGKAGDYQLRFDFKRQKSESVKIRIQELQATDFGEGLSLSAMTLQVGGKRGLFKNSQSRVVGMDED